MLAQIPHIFLEDSTVIDYQSISAYQMRMDIFVPQIVGFFMLSYFSSFLVQLFRFLVLFLVVIMFSFVNMCHCAM